MSDQKRPRKPTLEPAPNHQSGPHVPRAEQRIPLTPFLERAAPDASGPYSPTGFDPSRPSLWHSTQRQCPTQPTLQYRRLRRNGYRRVTTLSGPTLASTGIDRQDAPRNLSSINAILDLSSERPVARPLLPTPRSSAFSPRLWMLLPGMNASPDLGLNHISQDDSTPRGSSSTSMGSMSSPLLARLRSLFDRRNALANIRSPSTPAPTDVEFEDQSGGVDTRRGSGEEHDSALQSSTPQYAPTRSPEVRHMYCPSRITEHLDISAPPQYSDQGKLDDGRYDGDDDWSA